MGTMRLATQDEIFNRPQFGCFNGAMITASINELTAVLGEENVGESGDGKTLHEWAVMFNGKFFSIYDWKEYRNYPENEQIEWHIGSSYNSTTDEEFADAVREALKKL